MAKVNINIGNLFSSQGDYRKTVAYTLKSLQVAKQLNNTRSIANALVNLGDAYTKFCLLDSASYYTNASHQIALQLKDTLRRYNIK